MDLIGIQENEEVKELERKNAILMQLVNKMLQEKQECEDAVSRKAVIGIFRALWDSIGTIMDADEWEDVCKTTANELTSVTQKQPQVIRCKDCKYFTSMRNPWVLSTVCSRQALNMPMEPDDFCSRAERKEE